MSEPTTLAPTDPATPAVVGDPTPTPSTPATGPPVAGTTPVVVVDDTGRYGLLLGDPAEHLVSWLPDPITACLPYRVL